VITAKSSPHIKATFLFFKNLSKSKQSTDAVTLAAIFQNSGRKKIVAIYDRKGAK
jgi:hypothetical protein